VVVDLDFEEQMTQSEINSICHQLMHSYSANSRAAAPCHLHFTSIKARSLLLPVSGGLVCKRINASRCLPDAVHRNFVFHRLV